MGIIMPIRPRSPSDGQTPQIWRNVPFRDSAGRPLAMRETFANPVPLLVQLIFTGSVILA
jgi:hypothetical protein